jgi:hypothetical protein
VGAWYWLALGALATWRVTHLLHAEDGPWRVIARFRSVISRSNMLKQLVECFYCLSIWIAAPIAYALGKSWAERTLLVPALSAAAILLERVTQPPMPAFVEDPEEPNGMLWKKSEHESDGDVHAEP